MKVEVYKVSAFIDGINGGNPAGVVLDANTLTADQMQQIAKDAGFSETAFILKSTQADYKIRFFAPTTEVPLCGHATIATYYLLHSKGIITKTDSKQETSVGLLDMKFHEKIVFMEQSLPTFSNELDKNAILDCLNLDDSKLIPDLPIEIVSTGFPTIFIPLKSIDDLKNLQVNLEKSKIISNQTLIFHPFTFEVIHPGSIAFSRNFFPDITIDEDAATGTSTGALACYLYKYGRLKQQIHENLCFDQGNFMGKPSRLFVTLDIVNTTLKKVWVGGTCKIDKKFTVEV